MASYYPITPVKKRTAVPFEPAAGKHKSPIMSNLLDDYDDRRSDQLEESPAQLSSPGNTDNDYSVPNTPGSPLYVRAGPLHLQRRRSNTLPIESTSRMLAAMQAGSEHSDEYHHADSDDVYKTETEHLHKEDLYHRIGSVSVNDESPASAVSLDQNQDGDLSDLAKNGLPSACIFVANLAASQTDDQLMKSLQAHFKQFGRLHVKIRRDGKGNPYSFCQFESDEAARVAVRHGRNATIDNTGRRIRCEPAKVNRTLVLMKHDGSTATKAEVEKLIFGFGNYEALEFSDDEGSAPVHALTHGPRCFVRFTLRQDAVDCYQYFRFHATWGAEWTNNFSTHGTVPAPAPVAVDPFSIFIGKLDPEKTTEAELRKRFAEHGTINECNLVNKSDGRAAFAFIKFSTKEEALAAVEKENNTQFMGNVIHVQKRELHRKAARTASFSPRMGTHPSTAARERVPYIVNNENATQTISVPVHVYHNLMETYRQGQANHLRMRNPSVVSMVSNATTCDPSTLGHLYAPDPVGSHNALSIPMFHHPFQGAHMFSQSPSPGAQTQVSPRTSARGIQTGDRSPGSPGSAADSVPYNFSPGHLFPGYYNAPGFFGGYHPSHLAPRSFEESANRRDSFASTNFDGPSQFPNHMDKLPANMANMGINYQQGH